MISVNSTAMRMFVFAGSLPPAPPVAPREEKILPKSEWLSVEPMKSSDRRCDPGLDALFLSKECGKEPCWLGSRKK